MAHYDILIKGGMVADGKRGRIRRSDIGINADKIKKIGELSSDTGRLEVDASGQYISPGFIDITNHSDTHWRLFTNPGQESMLYQGVTTILGGVCGSSLAPLVKGEDIEGIQKWVDVSQININWQSMDELFEELERQKFGVNFATLAGHGTLRRGVIGDEPRVASQQELGQMQLLLERSLKSGAYGFSTSLGSAHGKPASDDEVVELLKVTADHGAISKHHLKHEGIEILPALSHLLELIRKSGVRCQISHLKAIGRRAAEHIDELIAIIDRARHDGYSVAYDVSPYTRTGSNLYMLLPAWAIEGGKDFILENIRDPEKRKGLINSLKEATLHYDRITVASAIRNTLSIGKTIADLASAAGKTPEDIMLDLLDINELRVSIFNEVISPESLEKLITKEYAAIASDGVGYEKDHELKKDLPHPRSFGAFPKVFVDFVRERPLINWEDAVHKMTGLPAQILGLEGRGVLEAGAYADITIFNPETIHDRATYDNPFQFAEGISWVFINGKPAIKEGKAADVTGGKILRKK